MPKDTVLLTGASGYIASQLRDEFASRYDLRLVDVQATGRDGQPIDGIEVADLIDSDRSRYAHLFHGVDAVVHLGYKRSSGTDGARPIIDRFDDEHANVQMANNVYRCAFDAGVRRVVVRDGTAAAAVDPRPVDELGRVERGRAGFGRGVPFDPADDSLPFLVDDDLGAAGPPERAGAPVE